MITIFGILKLYGVDTHDMRLVRHGNKELPVLDTFRLNRPRFEAYQSFQEPTKFKNAKHIAVFAPLAGNASLFLGLWKVLGSHANQDLAKQHHSLIDQFEFPKTWHNTSGWYDLELDQSK